MNDGTQERTLDPPDETLSDAELRECERAARIGFDARDDKFSAWLRDQLADALDEISGIVRANLLVDPVLRDAWTRVAVAVLRDRYVAECAEEYWGDLIEQEKYAQEP